MKKLLSLKLNPDRTYGLDILRAIAILFVVIGHGESLIPEERYKYVKFFIFDGVSMFFVLSGFLIGTIIIKILEKQRLSFKIILNFWIRRWFRTLPNYFLILILLLILNLIFTDGFNFFQNKYYFIFSQNLFSEHPSFFPEAWSLSIEEWFYLLIPILILIILNIFKLSIRKTILFAAIGIIVGVTFVRYYKYTNLSIDSNIIWNLTFRKQVLTQLDSLMYGIIGAYIFFYFKDYWFKYNRLFFVIGITLFIGIKFNLLQFENYGLYHCVFIFSLASLATLFLLPFLTSIKKGKGFLYKFLTYISLISYSMYLINLSVVQKWILGSIDWSYLQNFNGYLLLIVRYLSYWFFTIFISILIYKYFEIPTTNLRDKVKIK